MSNPAAAILVAALAWTSVAPPVAAGAPDASDVRSGLEALRADTVATVADPKLHAKLTKAVDRAVAKLDKAALKGTPKAFKKPRNAVRGYLKKLGWKERKGLLKPKKKARLDAATGDPLRDRAAALLALLDALIAGAEATPAAGVVGPEGGSVVSEDGNLSLQFPPGALPKRSAIVTIRRLDPAALGPDLAAIPFAAVYGLGPDRLEFDVAPELALKLDAPADLGDGGASSTLPLLVVLSSKGKAELPDQEIATDVETGARTLRVALDHFSSAALIETATEGLTVTVNGLPSPPIIRVEQDFTLTVAYEAEETADVRANSILYRLSSFPSNRIDTREPGPFPFGSEVEPGVASADELRIDHFCKQPGLALYQSAIDFGEFRAALDLIQVLKLLDDEAGRDRSAEGRFLYRLYCEPPEAQQGFVDVEVDSPGEFDLRVAPPRVTRFVGESFDVELTEDFESLDHLLIRIWDLRDEEDIISDAELAGFGGANDAELAADSFGSFLPHAVLNIPPYQGGLPVTPADGVSHQSLRFTCLKPGFTILAYDAEMAVDDDEFEASLSTLVTCVPQEVGVLPPPVQDEEPNDSPQTAQAFVLGNSGFAQLEGSLGPGDADWYSFDVAQPTTLAIEEAFAYGPVPVVFSFTNSEGEDVACEEDNRIVANVEPGTYFVGVEPKVPELEGNYLLQAGESALVVLSRGAGAADCEPPPSALCPQNGIACGNQGGGICVRGLCMVEVPMNIGASGSSVCATEGLSCSGVPALGFPEGEACLAFHPTALETFGPSGWRQSVYCNGAGGAACNGQVNVCWDCPFCLADQLDCTTGASAELDALFASCE